MRVQTAPERALPDHRLPWTVGRGAAHPFAVHREVGLTADDLEGDRNLRIARIPHLLDEECLDSEPRWQNGRTQD